MECDYSSSRQDNLNKHIKKRHSYAPSVHNIPPKIACHEPIIPDIIEPPANDHLLEQLENHEIQSLLEQNSQVGFGITQMTSPDENIPHEIQHFFRDERPWGTDRNLRQIYIQNFPRIRDSETLNQQSRIYLGYLRHDCAPLIERKG